jgi:hypothetical protein
MKQWLSWAANDLYLGQENSFFLLDPKALHIVMFEALTEGNIKIIRFCVIPCSLVLYFSARLSGDTSKNTVTFLYLQVRKLRNWYLFWVK